MSISLGKKRDWLYPLKVSGRWQKVHRRSGILLQAILFGLPWLSADLSPYAPEDGSPPAVLFDLVGRRLYFFGASFTPRDTVFLVLMGLGAALTLFMVTALVGRLWCGFACPQTVFLEEWVRPIEEWLEGSRSQRRRRDQGPWTLDKARRKAAKWSIFAALAGVLAMTLVSYFVPARVLWTGGAGPVAYGMVGVLGSFIFLDLAWFREQFCVYLCPYARFQGALTDGDSLVISYEKQRGEPRGKRRRKRRNLPVIDQPAAAAKGACIDCNKCVAVCPTGIDIRDGFQLECISCARCIDACESVMSKFNEPTLVRYMTENQVKGRKSSWIRPRTAIYGSVLTVITVAFLGLMATRHELEATVNRARGTLFHVDPDGYVRNTYMLRLTNNFVRASHASTVHLEVEGMPDAELIHPPIRLGPGETTQVAVVVRVPPDHRLERTTELTLRISTDFDEIEVDTTFKSNAEQAAWSGRRSLLRHLTRQESASPARR